MQFLLCVMKRNIHWRVLLRNLSTQCLKVVCCMTAIDLGLWEDVVSNALLVWACK